MATPNFSPKTVYEGERQIVRAQPSSNVDKTPFSSGAYPDLDGSRIPAKGVHTVENYRCFPWGLKTRGGTKAWSDIVYPAITGTTGMALTKVGDMILRSSGGRAFTADDVGSFIVHDTGDNELIVAYESPYRVRVELETAYSADTAAYMRGPRNAYLLHDKSGKIILFIGSKLYYTDAETVTAWTEIYKSGTCDDPANSESMLRKFGDYAVLFNENGLYKIDIDNGCYFPMNARVPSVRITDVTKTDVRIYCRNYVYSVSRITGIDPDRNKWSDGCEIQLESGANAVTDSRDKASVFSERPVGDESTTYAFLTGGTLVSPYDSSAGWSDISVGQFTIEMNGTERNVKCNFVGCVCMADVAARIQAGLRDYESTATCEYVSNHFVITLPDEGSTLDYVTAGEGVVDIGTSAMQCHTGSGYIVDSEFTLSNSVSELTVPVNASTGLRDAHWTHFSLYGSLDAGENGVDPTSGDGNNPELLMWINDIPIAKAFMAKYENGYVYVQSGYGEFVIHDRYNTIKFMSGAEITLSDFVDSLTFDVFYAGGNFDYTPAAIGGGRIMQASQTGYTVTRSAGDTFLSTDVGRQIIWASGEVSNIIAYVDANTVTVHESQTVTSTGCTLDPVSRKYCDTLRDNYETTADDDLRSRISADYINQNRLYTPLPNCSIGKITASMLWCSDENKLYYCNSDVGYEHLAGYHYALEQRQILEGVINELSEISNTLSIKLNHETRAIDLTSFNSITLDTIGTAIITAQSSTMIDDKKGVKHFSAVVQISKDLQIVITGEPGIRTFSGSSYGENLATDRIQKVLEELIPKYSCQYDPVNGFTFWGKLIVNE